jgi:DNA-binding response OmpR family regulator
MPLLEAVLTPPDLSLEPSPFRKRPARARVRILSVSPAPQDHADLRRVVKDPKWQIDPVNSCRDAIDYLSRTDVFLILCEHSLPDGNWKRMLDYASLLPVPPPVIVTSRLADDHLWAEVLNLGGFDVLAKPYNEREVRHVLDSAWMQRTNPVGAVRAARTA